MNTIFKRGRKVASATILASIVMMGNTTVFAANHPLLKNEPVQVDQMPEKDELIVAYYGRPGVKSLGVLGQHSVPALKTIIKKKAAEYAKITGKHVKPGFDIIYGLAAAEPGSHKDYIIHLNSKKLIPYLDAAENEDFVVFIDTQLGKHTPQDAIHHVLKYLKYHNVHIAIDPEFEVSNLSVRPGKKIGHVTGEWINQVQETMDRYMRENGITEKKMLVVHMFRHTMVTNKTHVKHYKNINLIMNLDGHGSPKLKIDIYNAIYRKAAAEKVAGGFKLFFNEDKPMMTPKQVMGIESTQGAKVKYPPKFINYQ
jgi:hypothetical protein